MKVTTRAFALFLGLLSVRALFLGLLSVDYGNVRRRCHELFRNSYRVYEYQRNDIGMYRDSSLFSGSEYHPASVANVGMGLVALCIADEMGWDNSARAKVLKTLQTVMGQTPGFHLDTNQAGFARHFVDMETGANAWDSEYSTIDTAILVYGARFAQRYYYRHDADESISTLVNKLWDSVDWEKAFANANTGEIYLALDEYGNGVGDGTTRPWNEYMLVAYLGWRNGGAKGVAVWDNFYKNPNGLPTKNYWGIDLLTDSATHYVPHFLMQFTYYLCHHTGTSSAYMTYFQNAMEADKKWWSFQEGTNGYKYKWGLGAGSSKTGSYHADAIDNNPDMTVSPHIMAGFLPLDTDIKYELLDLEADGQASYILKEHPVLWRYSTANLSWRANEIQGVDYSTMLFGLASLPEHCGVGFFSYCNDW